MSDDDMTVAQAAELLGVRVPSIYSLMKRGRLQTRRVGFIHLLSRADVLAYQASRAGKGKPGPPRGTPRPRREFDHQRLRM